MTWNYRITCKQDRGHTVYGLSEVFYSKKGKVKGYTDWINPNGYNDPEALRDTLIRMLGAFDRPIAEDINIDD